MRSKGIRTVGAGRTGGPSARPRLDAVGDGRSRLRRRRSALIVVVLVAGTAAIARPASASDSNGLAIVWNYHDTATIEWGQSLTYAGYVDDESESCFTVPFQCDTPTGTITLSGVNHTIDYGSGPLEANFDDPDASFATFAITIPAEKFTPGIRYVVADYHGNFDDYTTYMKVTVTKQACHSFTLTQSSAGSTPGEPVTLTADLGDASHQGTLSIYDQDGLLATVTNPADGRSLSTTTTAMPQGSSSYYATYSGDGNHEGCTSATITHQVSTDAIPTARDDFASVAIGSSVSIPVLANDSDDHAGIRSETTNDPDFGDFEKVGDSYLYTPDPAMGNYQDSFDYIDYDSIGQSSAEAHVVITVGCTPNARSDGYFVRAYDRLAVPANGVRSNDDPCDSEVSLASGTAHGALDLQGDGSFTYQPDDGFTGTDSFTYQYTDQLESPVTGTATIEVVPRQAPPTDVPPPDDVTTTTTTVTSTTEPTTTSTTSPSTTTTTTTTTIPPTGGELLLDSLYQAVFDRAPDPAGSAHWLPELDAGTDPLAVARGLVDSAEFRRRIVRDAYQRCLGRQADPDGLSFWAGHLAGATPDELRAGLLGSPEALDRAGGDRATWTDHTFRALLGRDASSSEHLVIDPQLAGGIRRSLVASRVATFTEARRHLAEVWYPVVSGRAPTAAEADAWAADMAAGLSERSLIARLAVAVASSRG